MEEAGTVEEATDKGIIYVLENDAMPWFVKIGTTQNLVQRINGLNSSTSIPLPFRCIYAAIVEDPLFVERQLHTTFSPHRVSPSREFFRLPAECAIAAIELVAVETVSTDGPTIVTPSAPRAGRQVRNRIQAEIDLVAMLAADRVLPSQNTLAAMWSVPRSTVSDWINLFEQKGLVSRIRSGRHYLLVRPGVTALEAMNAVGSANGQVIDPPDAANVQLVDNPE